MSAFTRTRRMWGAGIAAIAVVAIGCTGDEKVEVVTDGVDGTDALAAAIDSTPTTGRFRSTTTMSFGGEDATSSDDNPFTGMETSVEGEFSGDDSRVVVSAGPDGTYSTEILRVGDRQFMSVAAMLPERDELDDALGGMFAEVTGALAGKEWIETPALDLSGDEPDDGGSGGLAGLLFGSASPSAITDPALVLDDVAEVRELEEVDIDGEQFRRFVGTLSDDELFGGGAVEPEEATPEALARMERIQDYARAHTSSEVEVLVDDAGRLRRIEVSIAEDVEDEYAKCFFLEATGSIDISIELFDLGEPIEISAPDPSTVIDESALEGFGSIFGSVADGAGTPSEVELDGREESERRLRDAAVVIGVDPATIPSMTDEQLADLITTYIDQGGLGAGVDGGAEDESYDEFEGCPA